MVGVVETHATIEKVPDLVSRSIAQGFTVHANPAMKYACTAGSHGGEAILTSKHMYAVPIENSIFESVSNVNDDPLRFSAVEIRFGHMSLLCISAYFWCSDGLSPRNWAILQQVSSLIWQFQMPFLFFADFNMPPEALQAPGWVDIHSAQQRYLTVPCIL